MVYENVLADKTQSKILPEKESAHLDQEASKFRQNRFSQDGFSLIEIIIVLGILGTLIALLLGGLGGAQKSAKIKEASVKAGQLQSQLLRYQADMGKLPTTAEGLTVLITNPGSAKWVGPYGSEEDTKDPWGNPFTYELSAKGPTFRSFGDDNQDGTADDLTFVNGRLVEAEAPAAGAGAQ